MLFITILICLVNVIVVYSQYPGECMKTCNNMRTDVLTLEMCRDAKKTLPRPKVGDFCSIAMEQGFSDVCVSMCMGESPKSRLAQACRAAAAEMPRPTVRRWCEHGYNVAYSKTMKDLKQHFIRSGNNFADPQVIDVQYDPEIEVVSQYSNKTFSVTEEREETEEAEVAKAVSSIIESESLDTSISDNVEVDSTEEYKVIANIPIKIVDIEYVLVIHDNDNIEDVVKVFCDEKMPEDTGNCVQDVLSTVLQKMVLQ